MPHSSCLCLEIHLGGAQRCPLGKKFMQKMGAFLSWGSTPKISALRAKNLDLPLGAFLPEYFVDRNFSLQCDI